MEVVTWEKYYIWLFKRKKKKLLNGAVSDSIDNFIPMCKYLLKNIKGSKDFIVVWTKGMKTKERNFVEFCDIQGITTED